MTLREVKDQRTKKDFILTALPIYKDDPNWVRPLDKDLEEVFDPEKNPIFKHGECIRWVLYNDKDAPIGRIAAFINDKTVNASHNDQPTGGVGFFECINDQAAANLLFDTSKAWLQARGMEAMDGPINFGERESWWGLIIEGFHTAQYKMNYNPLYYKELFENYGFKTFFEQYCYAMPIDTQLADKFIKRHAMIGSDPAFRAVHFRKNQMRKFAEDFTTIFNKAWGEAHGKDRGTSFEVVYKMFQKMKPVIDEKIIWFIYHNEEPIAFWVNIPDINQIFKLFNGKFGWIEKIRFIWYIKRRYCNRFIGLVFGIVPEYHARGVDGFMIVEGAKVIQGGRLYDNFEIQWVGDFNTKMVAMVRGLTTNRSRRLITYRKLFDETKEFKRMPTLRY